MGNFKSCGCGGKSEADKRRNKILEMRKHTFTIMLLGAGESGKTTVMRQMKLLQSSTKSFTESFRASQRPFVLFNVVEGALAVLKYLDQNRALAEYLKEINEYDPAKIGPILVDPASVRAAKLLLLWVSEPITKGLDNLELDVASAIKTLASDPVFVQVVEEPVPEIPLQDGWKYYMIKMRDEYPTWGGPAWRPSDDDILHCRVRTVGINKEEFIVGKNIFRVTDVGGQRPERSRWWHLFAGVHAIIYLQPMTDYNQTLFEERTESRFTDSIELWSRITNDPNFRNSAVIIFLNKADLLVDKFIKKKIPIDPALTAAYGKQFVPPILDPTISDDENVEAVAKWYREYMFSKFNSSTAMVFSHITTALASETQQIISQFVFAKIATLALQEYFMI